MSTLPNIYSVKLRHSGDRASDSKQLLKELNTHISKTMVGSARDLFLLVYLESGIESVEPASKHIPDIYGACLKSTVIFFSALD